MEVYSRWGTVRKGTNEISVDGKSYAEDEQGAGAEEGAQESHAYSPRAWMGWQWPFIPSAAPASIPQIPEHLLDVWKGSGC